MVLDDERRLRDLEEAVTTIKTQMKGLVGNGQPGDIQLLWARTEKIAGRTNIGIGIMLTLQVMLGAFIALLAGGVIRIH